MFVSGVSLNVLAAAALVLSRFQRARERIAPQVLHFSPAAPELCMVTLVHGSPGQLLARLVIVFEDMLLFPGEAVARIALTAEESLQRSVQGIFFTDREGNKRVLTKDTLAYSITVASRNTPGPHVHSHQMDQTTLQIAHRVQYVVACRSHSLRSRYLTMLNGAHGIFSPFECAQLALPKWLVWSFSRNPFELLVAGGRRKDRGDVRVILLQVGVEKKRISWRGRSPGVVRDALKGLAVALSKVPLHMEKPSITRFSDGFVVTTRFLGTLRRNPALRRLSDENSDVTLLKKADGEITISPGCVAVSSDQDWAATVYTSDGCLFVKVLDIASGEWGLDLNLGDVRPSVQRPNPFQFIAHGATLILISSDTVWVFAVDDQEGRKEVMNLSKSNISFLMVAAAQGETLAVVGFYGKVQLRRICANRGLEEVPFCEINGRFSDVALAHDLVITLTNGSTKCASYQEPRVVQVWSLAAHPACLWSLQCCGRFQCIGVRLAGEGTRVEHWTHGSLEAMEEERKEEDAGRGHHREAAAASDGSMLPSEAGTPASAAGEHLPAEAGTAASAAGEHLPAEGAKASPEIFADHQENDNLWLALQRSKAEAPSTLSSDGIVVSRLTRTARSPAAFGGAFLGGVPWPRRRRGMRGHPSLGLWCEAFRSLHGAFVRRARRCRLGAAGPPHRRVEL